MIFELKTSFELTKNTKDSFCPQAVGLGIFCFLIRMMLLHQNITGFKK